MPIYMKYDGIDGEVMDPVMPGAIDVMSFSWGVSNAGSSGGGGGGGAGKASFSDLSFMSSVSKASPQLFLHCCSGKHIKKAVLSCRKAGERPVEYLRITMEDVMITGFQEGGDAHSVPTESISMNYTKIEIKYFYQRPDGQTEVHRAGWDLKQNKGT